MNLKIFISSHNRSNIFSTKDCSMYERENVHMTNSKDTQVLWPFMTLGHETRLAHYTQPPTQRGDDQP